MNKKNNRKTDFWDIAIYIACGGLVGSSFIGTLNYVGVIDSHQLRIAGIVVGMMLGFSFGITQYKNYLSNKKAL